MKKHTLRIIFASLTIWGISLIFSACESVLFIELEEGVKLIVLNGALNNEEGIAVQVSRTRHILDNAAVAPLEDATVNLFEDGTHIGALSYEGNGYYTLGSIIPSIGKSYTIEVENAGYSSVRAHCEIPPLVPISQLDTITVSEEYEESDWYYSYNEAYLQFDLTLEDPGQEDNYYLLTAHVDRAISSYLGDTTVRVVDSIYWGGAWYPDIRDSTYSLYEIERHERYALIVSEDIVVEAYATDGLLFSDQLIDGKRYSVRGKIQHYDLESADSAIVDFRLQSISEDYYRYLKTRSQHYIAKDDLLSVPVIVYNNVEEGAGFLGGYSMDHHVITTFVKENDWDYYYYEY